MVHRLVTVGEDDIAPVNVLSERELVSSGVSVGVRGRPLSVAITEADGVVGPRDVVGLIVMV
jgi:hypothetical protein